MTAPTKPTDLDKTLKPLDQPQSLAIEPAAHIWLNASAGTGKTQVLSARVLRLLLAGTDPAAILCITFTKAGAAEMAHRVHDRLAFWVNCSLPALRMDLQAIGVDRDDPALQARARTLFARVIDSPTGAIRVQTIHSFCQWLLATFPFEAGILPGFKLIEDGAAKDLHRAALSVVLSRRDAEGARARDQLARLSRRLGETAAIAFIERAAGIFARTDAPRLAPSARDVRAALDLAVGDVTAWQVEEIANGAVADRDLAELVAAWRTGKGATEARALDTAAAWLGADPAARVALLPALAKSVVTAAGKLLAIYGGGKKPGKYEGQQEPAERVADACLRLMAMPGWCAAADDLAAGWALAADYAGELKRHKADEGLAEFDDLITRAAALLAHSELAEWIRFKLDQSIDHLLIDEAQDTNAAQWTIATGLTGEYFVGEGVRDEARPASMFVVGDRKQAIFRFQGTDPAAFAAARQDFAARAAAALQPFRPVDLTTNFRSSAAVLGFVDRWLDDGGVAAMGLEPPVTAHLPHRSTDKAGRVELWPPLLVDAARDSDETDDGDDAEEEDGWSAQDSLRAATDPASLKLAGAIAERVTLWLDAQNGGIDGLPVAAGDIMVLVRNRTSLAARIVAQLQARDVPVAGVDRFGLADPLAVQDLLAALRFMVQPDDEYSLAVLLVSPLVGWNQQQLYNLSCARGTKPLRQWLEEGHSAEARAAHARLEELRAGADFSTPFRTLDRLLAQPWGRAAMLARLGAEANDAIDALLAEALAFETRDIPSIIGFLNHVDRTSVAIKRQTEGRGGLVRVMTVHGSKGLQAPIVILADATRNPDKAMVQAQVDIAGWQGLPLFRIGAAARAPRLDHAHRLAVQAEREEHWRLFYVAATRAQRLLIITGTQAKVGEPLPANSWYVAAQSALTAMAAATVDIGWESGPALRHATQPGLWSRPTEPREPAAAASTAKIALPEWVGRTPPAEARPPRPLAPSQLGSDDAPQRPAGGARRDAIQRGILLHTLIERLPEVPPSARAHAADQWLAVQAPDLSAATRAAWAAEACAVLAHPDWAALFGPGSLAEAPFSAVIDGGLVIAGTVDRLLVTSDDVLIVDYKTGAQVPDSAADVAPAYLRQMAAYAAAMAVIFPGRRIGAALLYTAAPRLIALPTDLLAAHKPGFDAAKANLPDAGLEGPAPNA